MASLFTARRKPKRVASSEIIDENTAAQEGTVSVVRRPTNASKQKSKLRTAIDLEDAEQDVIPIALVKPTTRLGASALSRSGSDRRDKEDLRPSYSKTYLDELRDSTPTTPKDLSSGPASGDETNPPPTNRALDIASKFGKTAPAFPSTIPSAAEIAEKKARRARLAAEGSASAKHSSSIHQNDDYIPLDAYDSDGEVKIQRMQVGTHLSDRIGEEDTRLLRDDEDIMEGFDEYVDDVGSNRIMMSRHTQRQQDKRDKAQLREMIDQAEGAENTDNGSDQESDSDASLRYAYESAQTSHGLDGQVATRRRRERDARRPRQPEKTTPVPTLAAGIGRLKELLQQAVLAKQKAERRETEISARKKQVLEEQQAIQRALIELGEQLKTVEGPGGMISNETNGRVPERGLDTIGGLS